MFLKCLHIVQCVIFSVLVLAYDVLYDAILVIAAPSPSAVFVSFGTDVWRFCAQPGPVQSYLVILPLSCAASGMFSNKKKYFSQCTKTDHTCTINKRHKIIFSCNSSRRALWCCQDAPRESHRDFRTGLVDCFGWHSQSILSVLDCSQAETGHRFAFDKHGRRCCEAKSPGITRKVIVSACLCTWLKPVAPAMDIHDWFARKWRAGVCRP